jgi:hypothetical protein
MAKPLIMIHLSPSNAPAAAAMTNIDPAELESVASKNISGTPLTPRESAVFSRFDLIVTALVGEAYHTADRVYRNGVRTLAALVAVELALAGGWSLVGTAHFWHSTDPILALLGGLLATPLAPIAKDISTATAAAIKSQVRKIL